MKILFNEENNNLMKSVINIFYEKVNHIVLKRKKKSNKCYRFHERYYQYVAIDMNSFRLFLKVKTTKAYFIDEKINSH